MAHGSVERRCEQREERGVVARRCRGIVDRRVTRDPAVLRGVELDRVIDVRGSQRRGEALLVCVGEAGVVARTPDVELGLDA